jgi:hypothetical protein
MPKIARLPCILGSKAPSNHQRQIISGKQICSAREACAFAAHAGDGDMEGNSAFGLSRIQAEGWNAARKFLRGGDPGDAKTIAALNPYSSNPEKDRWYAGFNSAVEKL